MTVRSPTFVVVVCALSVAFSGCAHQTTVQSDPPGATVYVDDVKRGQTPLVVETRVGPVDMTRVEVVDETSGEAARFDLIHNSMRSELVIAGIGAGIATFISAGFLVVPYLGGVLALELFLVVGAIGGTGLPPELVGAGAFASGALAILSYAALLGLAASAPWVALGTIGEFSRTAPDEVFVDFRENEVATRPVDALRSLDGTAHGQVPFASKRAPSDAQPTTTDARAPTPAALNAEDPDDENTDEEPADNDARRATGTTAPDIPPDLVEELP